MSIDLLLRHLQGVEEVRSIVTSHPDLFSSLALVHVISLATESKPVLSSEHEVHENRTS